jgi:hypothetical protein
MTNVERVLSWQELHVQPGILLECELAQRLAIDGSQLGCLITLDANHRHFGALTRWAGVLLNHKRYRGAACRSEQKQ